MMTHKYRGSIVVLSISKSVEPNEEQKEMISGFQQGILMRTSIQLLHPQPLLLYILDQLLELVHAN